MHESETLSRYPHVFVDSRHKGKSRVYPDPLKTRKIQAGISRTGWFLMLLFATITSNQAQTHVQTRTLYQTTTSTTISRAFAASSTTGNLIVVHLDWDGQTRSISSVTDNKGNTYARINGPTNWNGPNYRAELWYAYNITGGGAAINITATLSGAPTSFSQIYITEYTNMATSNPLDQNSVAIGNTGAVSSGSQTTLHTNELVYGASIGASGVLSTGATFTNRSSANSNIIEDKNVASTGSYAATFTSAGGNWVAQMATFKSSTSLPIELVSFIGECNHDKIFLKWMTASEINNDYFTIQRSVDGKNWQDIGVVKGSGNSSTIQEYSFSVADTNIDISYFCLKQTDLNGHSKHSPIISVKNCRKDLNLINIYPSPSNGIFNLLFKGEREQVYSIEIYNSMGQMVYYSGNYQAILDLTDRPAGLYFVYINLNPQIIVRNIVIR